MSRALAPYFLLAAVTPSFVSPSDALHGPVARRTLKLNAVQSHVTGMAPVFVGCCSMPRPTPRAVATRVTLDVTDHEHNVRIVRVNVWENTVVVRIRTCIGAVVDISVTITIVGCKGAH